MNNEIVPYRKIHRVGDGQTSFSTERPRTGEEKYQPTMYEALTNLGNAMFDFTVELTVAMKPLYDAVEKIAEVLEKMPDPVAEARRRSKADVDKKRRELYRRR